MSHFEPVLTPAGEERRARIGRLAVRAAGLRRTRQRIGKTVAATSVLLALAGLLWHPRTTPPRVAVRPPVRHPLPPRIQLAAPPVGVTVTFVQTDPTIADRLQVDPLAPRRWQVIDDRELLDTLAAAGRPAGIIRTGGRVYLMAQ